VADKWTEEQKNAAYALLKQDEEVVSWDDLSVDLQCSVTALREGLKTLLDEHNCDYGDVDYDGTTTECSTCLPIRALLAKTAPPQ
jgi:hypothetical protein